MKTSACIFDFDGTVMDSEKYHHQAWEEVAKAIGTDFSYEEYLPFKSAGRQVVIPYLLKKANIEPTEELYRKYFKLREERIFKALLQLNENDIMPGLVKYVTYLRHNGILCAVASSSTAAHVTAKRFGLFDIFDAFVDGETQLPNKPQPHLFLHAAKLLQTPAQNCVVFEDSINGLLAAKNANMHVVGIQTYFTDIADRIIDNFVTANLATITF